MKTEVFVTFELEGFHSWPNAPEEVDFLRVRHRHIFKYRATIEVFHEDRDIEFILLKRELMGFCNGRQNDKSCETLAKEVCDYLTKAYPGRYVSVEVSEDGENGAIVHDFGFKEN